jgi:hypothetical protein
MPALAGVDSVGLGEGTAERFEPCVSSSSAI